MKDIVYVFLFFLSLLCGAKVCAQNYGDLYYTQLPFSNYKFSLKLATDCNTSNPAVSKTLHIVDIFSGREFHLEMVIDSAILLTGVNDPCMILPDQPCRKVYYMHSFVQLPVSSWGYTVAYFSCCRNFDNLEINNGNPTSSTSAYVIRMPTMSNNSAVFVNDTILNVCINKPFSYAFNAIDPDGDSLVYNFAYPKNYELSADRNGNWTVIQHTPPYPDLQYKFPYSVSKPIGNISIDGQTGLVKGELQYTGTFLLTVNVDEYRNSEKIASHQKEIVVQSVDCSKLPPAKAALPGILNECKSFSVHFPNHSNSSLAKYVWYFGDGDSSDLFEPEHRYADTGTFRVKMIMNEGYYCADSVTAKVLIYPSVKTHFIHADSCAELPITFTDVSTTTYGDIKGNKWYFQNNKGEFDEKTGNTIQHVFEKGEKSYLVKLESYNSLGCAAIDSEYIDVYDTPAKLPVHDTIISIGSTFFIPTFKNSITDNSRFLWSPQTGLNDAHLKNPLVIYNKDITYTVETTSFFGCKRKDSIKVRYFKGPEVYVPNAFTPNNDGKNDVFRVTLVGIKSLNYFRIFNRWGEKLFETSTSRKGWDGKINGKEMPAGVYIWEIKGVDEFNHAILNKGTVMLMR